jgi:hypothetical protein
MATAPRSRSQTIRPAKPKKASTEKAERDLLAGVMASISASLEVMSDDERERAVAAAEQAVAHLQ